MRDPTREMGLWENLRRRFRPSRALMDFNCVMHFLLTLPEVCPDTLAREAVIVRHDTQRKTRRALAHTRLNIDNARFLAANVEVGFAG